MASEEDQKFIRGDQKRNSKFCSLGTITLAHCWAAQWLTVMAFLGFYDLD